MDRLFKFESKYQLNLKSFIPDSHIIIYESIQNEDIAILIY